MLTLSHPTTSRCIASSSSRRNTIRLLHICTASAATPTSATAAATAHGSNRRRNGFVKAGHSNFNLRQRSARRGLLKPTAAVPDDRQTGAHPESASGSSGFGRNQEDRTMPGSAQSSDVGAAPESGTRPEYEMPSAGMSAGSASGMSSSEVTKPASSSGGGERASEDYTAATGGNAPSSQESPALNQRTHAARTGDLTGTLPGGPQEVLMGQGVPSSDTNPDMDPSESRMYSEREGKESSSMKEQFTSGKPSQGRDDSDQQSGSSGETGGSGTRAHPAARTAATAIGSAAGTVLGAVGGPVGAAAGAALGGGVGRNIADALAGHEEQAEVYDQGAEPEQVAEEAMAAGDAALRASGTIAEDIRGAASKAKAAASDLVDRASERSSDSSTSGGSSSSSGSSTAGDIRDRARADLDADRAGQSDIQGGLGTSVEYKSGDDSSKSDRHGHKHDRHSHKGVAGQLKDSVGSAAKSAVDKVASATEGIPLPTFPPATGPEDDIYASKAGSFVGEGGTSAEQAAAAVGERLQGAAESLRDSVSSTARIAADQVPSGEDVRNTARSTAHTAADYGSPETSARLTDMTQQSEPMTSQQRGAQEGSSSQNLGGIVDREGYAGLGIGDKIQESGYYAYRSVDDFGTVRDPLHTRRLHSSSSSSRSSRSRGHEFSAPSAAAAAGRTRLPIDTPIAGGVPAGEGRGGGDNAAAAAAAEGLEDSEARAAAAGWGNAGEERAWGGVGDWTSAEAVVKSAVGTPLDRRAAPSMMQSDNMDLTQMASAQSGSTDLGAGEGGIRAGGAAQAAGGYGGGRAGDFDIDSMREMGGELGGSNAELMSTQDRGMGSSSAAGGSRPGAATGVAAVDEGLPEGQLAAGGPDAQAAMGVERGESSSETTSDSTAERVAQVYGVPPEASPGKEEADTYRAEAGQEGSS